MIVAVADRGERSADSRFGRDVQDDGAERGAAHAGVGDADHVAHAGSSSFCGIGIMPGFGHAGSTDRAGVLQHEHVVRGDVELRDRGSGAPDPPAK